MSASADTSPSDIAVIGMACRLADAPDYASLRRNLWAARECIPRPSRDELAAAGVEVMETPAGATWRVRA